MADVFISYARSTAGPARAIAETLRMGGYSVWIDDDLPAHRDFPTAIEENLRAAKAVLVIWSEDARKSRWVPAEADVAHKANTLVQLSLDNVTPPLPFNRVQCTKMPDWKGDFDAPVWQKVATSIAELVGRDDVVVPTTPVSPKPAKPKAALLAVLPFDNMSSDEELAYFSDGVSEEIQQTVAQGSDLKVLARSSSFQFRGAEKIVRKVAASLNATHVLDGSVRRSGSRIRITAHLIECEGETTLWANRFDGDLGDVFDLQERIAEAVAQALKVTLAPQAPSPTLDPAVYEIFLKARAVVTEQGSLFDDASADAIPLLEQVVAAAPEYAPAWELLATCRAWVLRSGHRTQSYHQGRAGVLEAAEAALRLDPKRSGAYSALALLEPWGSYERREKLLRQALDAAPNEPGALTEMSTFCWSVGRFRDALRFAERACELNPLMPAARLNLAQMRTYVGDYEISIRMLQELHRRWPRNTPILAALLNFACSLGFWDAFHEAAKDVQTFEGWHSRVLHMTVSYAEALASDDPERRRVPLQYVTVALEKHGTVSLNDIEALGMLGFADEGMALLERASFEHLHDPDGPLPSGNYPGVILGRWGTLNKTPRFVDLCDRLGLCAYWVRSGRWPDCVDWAPYDFKAEVSRRTVASTPEP